MGSALPIKIENPFFYHGVNFNCGLRSHDSWGNSFAKMECTVRIILMYVRNVGSLRLATGGAR